VSHPYDALSPDRVLDAIDAQGFASDGRLLALNSYENRVYQVGLEDAGFVVAKFYRPERWSDAAILEEHAFSLALAAQEIPVVAPLADAAGHTLHHQAGFRFALFPRQGGRWPELDDLDHLEWIGRFLGRIHQLGAARDFQHRPYTDPATLGREPAAALLQSPLLPAEYRGRYRELSDALIDRCEAAFAQVQPRLLRLHGDCHPGNILWTEDGPHFVDMDDCRMGPAIQDLWMLLSGDRADMSVQLDAVLEGYRLFRDFDPAELALIEPLRALRLIHYAAWLARRWDDPAFPPAFPWFGGASYWEEQLATLEQQLHVLAQPPLQLFG
jgi:Ser/Thr protein kinase RdoA (MazF antagonist)